MAVTINASTTAGLVNTADTSGILALQTAGTTAVTVDASQNVGVGTASPTKKLDILSNTSQDGIRISGSTNPRLTIIDTTTPVQFDALCTDTEAVLRTDTNHPLVLSTNGTERARIPAAGGVQAVTTISVGNATPTTSGAGITFPATQSASSNANTLDDYEEGTWTPTLAFGGNSVGITYTTSYNTSSYTKIGSRVFVSGITSLTSKGSSTGNATLENLPFPATGVSGFSAVTISLAGVTFTGQYAAELDANNDEICFYQVTTAGVQSALTNTNFSNSSAFTFSFSYFT